VDPGRNPEYAPPLLPLEKQIWKDRQLTLQLDCNSNSSELVKPRSSPVQGTRIARGIVLSSYMDFSFLKIHGCKTIDNPTIKTTIRKFSQEVRSKNANVATVCKREIGFVAKPRRNFSLL
jgi:hypothetical protein